MNRLVVVETPIAQFVEQVHALASKYQTHWLTLYVNVTDNNHSMTATDRDDFVFLCTAFWDHLVSSVVQQDPDQQDHYYERNNVVALTEPGVSPGSFQYA